MNPEKTLKYGQRIIVLSELILKCQRENTLLSAKMLEQYNNSKYPLYDHEWTYKLWSNRLSLEYYLKIRLSKTILQLYKYTHEL